MRGEGALVGLDDLLRDIAGLDAHALEHRLSVQFAALGPVSFARDVVAPLMAEVGRRYEREEISVAGEHLRSATVRTLLGQAPHLTRRADSGPAAIFTTPEGELHELGLLVAALCAQSAGLRVIYLGPQLPAPELRHDPGAVARIEDHPGRGFPGVLFRKTYTEGGILARRLEEKLVGIRA